MLLKYLPVKQPIDDKIFRAVSVAGISRMPQEMSHCHFTIGVSTLPWAARTSISIRAQAASASCISMTNGTTWNCRSEFYGLRPSTVYKPPIAGIPDGGVSRRRRDSKWKASSCPFPVQLGSSSPTPPPSALLHSWAPSRSSRKSA